MTAIDRLSHALLGMRGPVLDDLAARAELPSKIARMAARGRGVSVDHHLRLAATLGLDPFVIDLTFAPFKLGRFNRSEFGVCVRRYRREDRRQNIHAGAAAAGLSIRALSFIENGRVVSIDATLAACRYIGIHPFAFAKVEFTCNCGCNPLSEKVAA